MKATTAILARGPAPETVLAGLTSLVAPTWAQIFPEARASHSTHGKSLHSTKYTRVGIGRHKRSLKLLLIISTLP